MKIDTSTIEPLTHINDEALLSEAVLAENWNRPEDKAWEKFQSEWSLSRFNISSSIFQSPG